MADCSVRFARLEERIEKLEARIAALEGEGLAKVKASKPAKTEAYTVFKRDKPKSKFKK